MPREVKEIQNFNVGTVLNASERDIPDNASSYSLNVNPMAEDGILSAINTNKLFFVSNDKMFRFTTPISRTAYYNTTEATSQKGTGYAFVDDIRQFDDTSYANVSVIGSRGKDENLYISSIYPSMEKIIVNSTLDASFTFTTDISDTDTEISFLGLDNAIALSGVGSSALVAAGFVSENEEATLEIDNVTSSNFHEAEMTITTPDGKAIIYIFDNSSGATGDLVDDVKVKIKIDSGTVTHDHITDAIIAAINHARGHNAGTANSKIILTQSTKDSTNDFITLNYVHLILSDYLNSGDYIQFSTSTYSALNKEILKITNVDNINRKITVKRGCFNTKINTIAAGTYSIFANRITIGGTQLLSQRGLVSIDSNKWSKLGANHIGGNSSFLNYSTSNEAHNGVFTTSGSDTIIFSNSAKTITFTNVTNSNFPFDEQDTITVYTSSSTNPTTRYNYGYSSKILKIAESSGSTVLTMETAPTDETYISGTIYLEANLLKNHTFTHKVTNTYQTVSANDYGDEGADGSYKVNDWKHRAYAGVVSLTTTTNRVNSGSYVNKRMVRQIDSGGYLESSPDIVLLDGTTDLAPYMYPRLSNDKYIRMYSNFVNPLTSIYLNKDINTTDTILSFNSTTLNQYVSKGDIIAFAASSDGTNPNKFYGNVEYMKVESVTNTTLTVIRNIYGSNAFSWDGDGTDTVLHKASLNSIYQPVSKDKLKALNEYTLTFYARDNHQTYVSPGKYTLTNASTTISLKGTDMARAGTGIDDAAFAFTQNFVTNNSTNGTAVITVNALKDALDIDNTSTITLTSHDGHAVTYIFDQHNDGATGTLDGSNRTRIQLNSTSTTTNVATQIASAINNKQNGHGDRMVASSSSNVVTLVYEPPVDAIMRVGMTVTGGGLPADTTITKVVNNTDFTILTAFDSSTATAQTLTFKQSSFSRGALGLRVNGGYIDSNGDFKSFVDLGDDGYITANELSQTTRWIPFDSLDSLYNDNAFDSDGNIANNRLDNIWRRFDFTFKLPSELLTDLEVEFSSQGAHGSYLEIDQTDLREECKAFINNNSSHISDFGLIESKNETKFVFWDSIKNSIGYVQDAFSNQERTVDYSIEKSIYASDKLSASSVCFTPNNRETHVGLGGNKNDSPPQWIGYINRKVFGESTTNELYQDEDTVHSYGLESSGSLSKICVAGEHEYLAATWDNTAKTLTITHTAHSMNTGDNIVIREWADASNTWSGSGVWVVTNGSGADAIVCKRFNTLDPDPDNTGFLQTDGSDNNRDQNTGRINYRPYYYYGIVENENSIYRITPGDRIADGSGTPALDTTYISGTVEKTSFIAPASSITTCYAKNPGSETNALTGGKIYVMSNVTNIIYVVDVQAKYDSWEATQLTYNTIIPEFKSFKWSNDHVNGNIGGDTAVFDSLAVESSPTIDAAGIMSDIVETKGPMSTYVHNAEGVTVNKPDNFDTRLWIQFRPSGETGFGEGDRFLFCGKTETGNTDGEDTIYFADRTPPTNVLFPRFLDLSGEGDVNNNGDMYPMGIGEGPGYQWHSHYHGNVPSGFTRENFAKYSNFSNFCWHGGTDGHHKLEYIGVKHKQGPTNGNPSEASHYSSYHDYLGRVAYPMPYYQFGYNVGWQGRGGNFPEIIVAKYGLCPMADNDKDGIIDGTGVIVPSTHSIQTGNPFGNLHQRISAHAVSLIGGCDLNWSLHSGKMNSYVGDTWRGMGTDNSSINSDDAPYDTKVEKCIFVCTDMHYGDYQPTKDFMSYTDLLDGSSITTSLGSTGTGLAKFTVSNETLLNTMQAGDTVYVQDTAGEDWKFVDGVTGGGSFRPGNLGDRRGGVGATITKIEGANVTIDIQNGTAAGTDTGYIYMHTQRGGGYYTEESNDNLEYNHGVAYTPSDGSIPHLINHYAFDENDKSNGKIFTEGYGCGNFSRKWYSKPTIINGYWNAMPGILHNIERLDYRAGFMIKPFTTKTDNEFNDLIIGGLTAIDVPSSPDVVYHKKQGNKLHDNIGNSATDNEFSNRMYVSCKNNNLGEINTSKVWVVDTSRTQIEFSDTHFHRNEWRDGNSATRPTSAEFNGLDVSNYLFQGTLAGTPYITSNTDNHHLCNAEHFPVIKLTSGTTNIDYDQTQAWSTLSVSHSSYSPLRRNGLAGCTITVVDSVTGRSQTRYIVGNSKDGSSNQTTADTYIKVHWPFGHAPAAGDKFYVQHHAHTCVSPLRLYANQPNASLSDFNKADPILSDTIFKPKDFIYETTSDGLVGSGNSLTAECTIKHGLTTGDKIKFVRIFDDAAGEHLHDRVYPVVVTSPTTFSISPLNYVVSGTFDGAEWTNVSDNSSKSNPLKLNIDAPYMKTFFGGLDMRKLRGGAVSAIADDTDDIRLTSADHRLSVGDFITYVSDSTSAQTGTYIVKEGAAALPSATEDTFDVENTTSTNTPGDWTTNQWETVLVERGNTAKIGELRSTFGQWDKGNILGNVARYDTTDDNSLFYNLVDTSVDITAISVGNATGDFFLKNKRYEYKLSLMYDGYQESLLSQSVWAYEDSETRSRLSIRINVKNYSKRLTAVCLYRRDSANDFFKLVEQIDTASGWSQIEGNIYTRQVEDDGTVGASYSARTGLSEVLDTIRLKYGMSAQIDGYLFAADCYHEKIKNASNMIFRSKPGMFSIFDYANDFLTIKSKPTAIANFNSRLYIFDKTNIYIVNQNTLAIEDTFEGIGCLDKDSLVITENGMFFADKNGAYMHNGQVPIKISASITSGGDSNVNFGGTDNVANLSWENIVTNVPNPNVKVSFLSKMDTVIFIVNSVKSKSTALTSLENNLDYSVSKQYMWAYNIIKSRWDLWELAENSIIGKPFIGSDSKTYVSINEGVYELLGGADKKELTWISKKMKMGADSNIKVFNKIKLNGSDENLALGGENLESSQRLLVSTNKGLVAESDIEHSTESTDDSSYKLKGSNRKGRWVQFKLEDITEDIDSIGIIFRRRATK